MIRLRVLGVREGLVWPQEQGVADHVCPQSGNREQCMLMLVSFLLFTQSKILAWANSVPTFEGGSPTQLT